MSVRGIAITVVLLGLACLAGIVAVGLSINQQAEQADVLRRSYPNDPDTLNLLTANDNVSTAFQSLVYEPLAERDMANPDEWLPVLATRWEFDEESLTYTIHLRRGVKWHPMRLPNGELLPETEFTARDVEFTFACVFNEHTEASAYRSYYADPDPEDPNHPYKINVEAVDPYTVKIRWSEPYFLAKTWTIGIPILPRHVYSVDENGEPIALDFSLKEFADGFNMHWANTKMCGTGPLVFREWQRGRRLLLERNPDYWGEPYPFRKVVYSYISNPNTVMRKLLRNELDFAGIQRADQFLEAHEAPSVEAGNVILASYAYPGYRYIGYNLERELFQDVRVRWALSHAVPVQKIIDEVWKGLAVRITGPFLPGSSAADPSLKPVTFDLGRSRELLDEAGWIDSDNNGIRDKEIDGRRVDASFTLMIYSGAPQYLTLAKIVKENCMKVGVDVNIEPAKWPLMLQSLRKRSFDAAMLGWALSWKGDPKQIWHSSQADEPDSSNAISYRNEQVDRLIEKLHVTLDEEKQTELYHQIHRLIYEDQPYTFLFQDKATAGYDARIKNVHFYQIRPCVDSSEWRVGPRQPEKANGSGKGERGEREKGD